MSRTLAERGVCVVLKGGGFSEGLMEACLWEALRLIHAQETQFDVDGEIAVVRIVNRARYQVLGGFCGVLVEVRVESEERDTIMTMLVNPHCSGPTAIEWVDFVFEDGHWRLADEEPLLN